MKKTSIFCAALLALGLVGCDDKSDLGIAQTNPQEAVYSIDGFTIEPLAPFNGASFDLNSRLGQEIPVLKFVSTAELPEGAYLSADLMLAQSQDFADAQRLTLDKGADGVFSISEEALTEAIQHYFGKAPLQRDMFVRVAAYIVDGTNLTRIQDASGEWFMAKGMVITPADPNLPIEATYYMVTSLDNYTVGAPMAHSAKHQYDDPYFSAVVDVTDADLAGGPVSWLIAPESAKAQRADWFGAADGQADLAAMSGGLKAGGLALQFTEPAKYQVKVNMEDLTYTVGFAADQLWFWVAGKWDSGMYLHNQGNFVNYDGVGYLKGSWKLTANKDFQGLQLGKGEEPGTITFGSRALPFALPTNDEGVATKGLYYVTADMAELTYTTYLINELGVVGTNNGWGAEADVAMTPNASFNVWTATVTFPEADKNYYKVRANNGWDVNYGGDAAGQIDGISRKGGENFEIEGGGTYEITIDFSAYPAYIVSAVKK